MEFRRPNKKEVYLKDKKNWKNIKFNLPIIFSHFKFNHFEANVFRITKDAEIDMYENFMNEKNLDNQEFFLP